MTYPVMIIYCSLGVERLRNATAWVIPNVSFIEGGKIEKCNSMGDTNYIIR